MDLKRVDGLQNLMGMLDHAKHQYWSEHGVNNDHLQAAPDVLRPAPSSAIHYPFASGNRTLSKVSEREVCPYFHPSNSSAHHPPTSLSAKAKMVEFGQMDTSSLIAAALAPPALPGTRDPVQPNEMATTLGKRRRQESSTPLQHCGSEQTSPLSQQRQRKQDGALLGERLATGAGSSDHGPALNAISKDKYDINSNRYGNEREDEDKDLPAATKPHQRVAKPTKRVSSHSISKQELSSLGISPSGRRHRQKVKSAYNFDHILDDDQREDKADSAASQPQTPHRCAPRGPVKRTRLLINSDPFTPSPPGSPPPHSSAPEDDNDDEEEEEEEKEEEEESGSEFATPSPRRKRTNTTATTTTTKKRKKSKTSPASTTRSVRTTASKKPKKASKANMKVPSSSGANTTTASLKRSASAKNRNYVFPVASTLSEASEADRMMFRMKGEGKSWKEITAEWSRMTGRQPGSSSLSVRYIKLKEKFARMGDPDFARLLHFKYTLEQTFETTEKWDRIAAMIVADGGGTYTGQALRRKFRNLVEGGLQKLQKPDADADADADDDDDAEGTVGAGTGAAVVALDGDDEGGDGAASVLADLDDLDRELMGDGDSDSDGEEDGDLDVESEGEEEADAEAEETPSKKKQQQQQQQKKTG